MSSSRFQWLKPTFSDLRHGRCRSRRPLDLSVELLEARTVPASLLVTTTVDAAALDPTVSADINVNHNVSLRSAIQRADFLGGVNTITLPGVSAPYRLTLAGPGEDQAATGDLDIANLGTNLAAFDLTLQGAGAATTVIDGNPGGMNPRDRVFHILAGATVSISGVTIQNGLAPAGDTALGGANDSFGGGILNQGSLTVADCILSGNQARGMSISADSPLVTGGSAAGGGIYNTGPLLVIRTSTLSGNQAVGGDGTSTDVSSAGAGGAALGGGIANDQGALVSLTDSTLDNNQANGGRGAGTDYGGSGGDAQGGGLFTSLGAVKIFRSTLSHNQANGGIGAADVNRFGIRGGNAQGGGIDNQASELTLSDSTVSTNTAAGGEAQGNGSLKIGGTARGGGINTTTTSAPLRNSTIAFNQAVAGNGDYGGDALGGGVFVEPGSTEDVVSTLIAFDTVTEGTGPAGNGMPTGPDVFGDFNSAGHNLIRIGDGSTGLTDNVNSDQVGGFGNAAIPPGLDPLDSYGGPTKTHRLQAGSHAIDRGANPDNLATDQRGAGFLRESPAHLPDVGAFEVQVMQVGGLLDFASAVVTPTVPAPPVAPTLLGKVRFLGSGVSAETGAALQAEGDYVNSLYHQLLGRAPDLNGLNYWVFLLENGVPRLAVAAAVWGSSEHRGIQVDRFYQAFLHRAADPGGRTFFTSLFQAGLGEVDVARLLLTSAEYQAAHPDPTSFVNALYQDVLGHVGDAGGQTFWQQVLQSGVSWAAVAQAFLTAPETDSLLLDRYFAEYLGRPVDPLGRQTFLSFLRSGVRTPEAVAELILASDEYYARPH